MGRPTASEENKRLAAFFANVVTCPAELKETTVARSGEGSVFYVFAQCFPQLLRTVSRSGLTQLEFNKHLQNKEFPQIRKRNRRKAGAPERRQLDFFPDSSFRFAGRKWRNPDKEEDLQYLQTAWPVMTNGVNCVSFNAFLAELKQAIFLDDNCEEGEETSDAPSACSTPNNSTKPALFRSEEQAQRSVKDDKNVAADKNLKSIPWWESSHRQQAEAHGSQTQAAHSNSRGAESVNSQAVQPRKMAEIHQSCLGRQSSFANSFERKHLSVCFADEPAFANSVGRKKQSSADDGDEEPSVFRRTRSNSKNEQRHQEAIAAAPTKTGENDDFSRSWSSQFRQWVSDMQHARAQPQRTSHTAAAPACAPACHGMLTRSASSGRSEKAAAPQTSAEAGSLQGEPHNGHLSREEDGAGAASGGAQQATQPRSEEDGDGAGEAAREEVALPAWVREMHGSEPSLNDYAYCPEQAKARFLKRRRSSAHESQHGMTTRSGSRLLKTRSSVLFRSSSLLNSASSVSFSFDSLQLDVAVSADSDSGARESVTLDPAWHSSLEANDQPQPSHPQLLRRHPSLLQSTPYDPLALEEMEPSVFCFAAL